MAIRSRPSSMYNIYSFLLLARLAHAATRFAPEAIAAQYSLTTSTTLPFPAATQSSSESQSLLVDKWGLNKAHIQDGPDNLAFITDPFPQSVPTGTNETASTSPVLQVTYNEGSFSHDTGGAQFYSLWNTSDGSSFNTMMVSYELAFNSGFDWVKGGKLPGLRGGLDSTGCSGGNKATGLDCFSARLMWRASGEGEIYAYIPSPNNLCSQKSVICNSDFGISVQRGSFGFVSGQWTRVTLLVRLNNPPNVANGYMALYFNDLLAISQSGLQIRASDSVAANGFYFSTFFGGSDTSWATPVTAHTYFRNIQLWGSSAASNLTGAQVSESRTAYKSSVTAVLTVLAIVAGSVFCV